MEKTRRDFLDGLVGLAAATSAMLIAAPRARAAEPGPACYDPDKLPFSQKNRRRGLGYVELSADPARQCGKCAFFTGSARGCGTCQMLSGGPVNATAVCNSFAIGAPK